MKFVLIVWILGGLPLHPVVVGEYNHLAICEGAGEIWRGHKETYRYRDYKCVPKTLGPTLDGWSDPS